MKNQAREDNDDDNTERKLCEFLFVQPVHAFRRIVRNEKIFGTQNLRVFFSLIVEVQKSEAKKSCSICIFVERNIQPDQMISANTWKTADGGASIRNEKRFVHLVKRFIEDIIVF